MMCLCPRCQFAASLGFAPDDEFGILLGGRIIAAYTLQHNSSIPCAIEALDREFATAIDELVATYGRIHGLDQHNTWAALITHGVNPPRCFQ